MEEHPGVVLPMIRRSEEHTSELQSPCNLVCRLLLEKKNNNRPINALTDGTAREEHTRAVQRPHTLHVCWSVVPLTSTRSLCTLYVFFFFFNDTATTEIYTLSLHDALPIFIALHASIAYKFRFVSLPA